MFGSRFSLAVHGHIEFADLIKNRWYNLAGTVHHIEQSVTDAIPDDDWTFIWGHQFYTKKKKNPPFFFLFQPEVFIHWNTVHKIIIRLNDKKIPRKRGLEAIHVVYKNVWYPPLPPIQIKTISTKKHMYMHSHLVLEYIIHQNPYTTWSMDDLTQVISGQCTFESYLYVVHIRIYTCQQITLPINVWAKQEI